jgi:hypothetical protein
MDKFRAGIGGQADVSRSYLRTLLTRNRSELRLRASDDTERCNVMGVPSSVEAGKHWLVRARECRRLAQTFSDPQTRERILHVADDYDQLAMQSLGRVQLQTRIEVLQDE